MVAESAHDASADQGGLRADPGRLRALLASSSKGVSTPKVSEREFIPVDLGPISVERLALASPVDPHRHPFLELVIVTDGSGEHHSEAGVARVRRGSVLIVPVGAWHAWEPHTPVEIFNVYVGAAALTQELFWLRSLPGVGEAFTNEDGFGQVLVTDLTAREWHAAVSGLEQLVAARGKSRFDVLAALYELLRSVPLLQDAAAQDAPHGVADSIATPVLPRAGLRYRTVVARTVAVMHAGLAQPWTLEELAREGRLSESQLVRVFRADTGSAPLTYLQQLRAERFARLLRTTSLPVAQIGTAVGWLEPAYASRRFKAFWGVSPSEYRRQMT
jgi:AraC-like DNA-binding protein/mannose-6-phosphate isomerase-like protein (cupin superfamily)